MKRILFIILGCLFVVLAFLGIVLPVLPTTPFLLLALWLFMRSSPRLTQWLLTNRFCGEYLDNYRSGRGVPLKSKVVIVTLLWLTIGVSIFLMRDKLWLQLLLFAVAVGVSIHVLSFKTYRKNK